jgi:hypothetical protein
MIQKNVLGIVLLTISRSVNQESSDSFVNVNIQD